MTRTPSTAAPENDADAGATARALLAAFTDISSDLDTRSVLHRIVESACELTGARRAALAVMGRDDSVSDVVVHAPDAKAADALAALVRSPAQDSGAADGAPLVVPIRLRGADFGRLHLVDKADGAFDGHDGLLVQSLAGVAGIVIENARAYGLSERRRRWLEMYGDLSERLAPPITGEDAMGRIAEALAEASGAVSAAVVQVTESDAPAPAAVAGARLDLTADENAQLVSKVHEALVTGDVVETTLGTDQVAVIAPLRAHLSDPKLLVLVHDRQGRPDPLEERELLTSFADQAALALDRAQALADREEMAVISDRDRIARELHDVVIQRLFATGLHMQSARSAADTPDLKERIDTCVRDLDQTIRDIRATIFQLQNRPQSSLRSEVRDVIRDMIPRLGFAPSVHTQGPVDQAVDPKVQQQLVAVLREALTNVAQHADAGSAQVDLQVTPTHLRLRVTDNGKGLPEDRVENGLRGVRRRALLLGGSLDLWPNDPSGTVFVWAVPYGEDGSTGA
jgi:signal transduction histidine kinase